MMESPTAAPVRDGRGPEGFVLEDGNIAPAANPIFEMISCPYCKKRMAPGREDVVIFTQTGDETSRVFIHKVCLITLVRPMIPQESN